MYLATAAETEVATVDGLTIALLGGGVAILTVLLTITGALVAAAIQRKSEHERWKREKVLDLVIELVDLSSAALAPLNKETGAKLSARLIKMKAPAAVLVPPKLFTPWQELNVAMLNCLEMAVKGQTPSIERSAALTKAQSNFSVEARIVLKLDKFR